MVDKRKDKAMEQIKKSMSQEELDMIKLKREFEETYIKNDDAKKCAIRTDQYYQQYDQALASIEGTLYNILNASQNLTSYQVQITSGGVIDNYPGSDKKMTIRDLEIASIVLRSKIGDGLRGLWLMLAQLYKYVGRLRIDKKIFFTEEQYNKKVGFIKAELKKNGIDIYQERN